MYIVKYTFYKGKVFGNYSLIMAFSLLPISINLTKNDSYSK